MESNEKWVKQLIDTENQQVRQLNEIVAQSLKEERLLVHKLRHEVSEKSTLGERIADRVASFGGSWKFIGIFLLILVVWIVINVFQLFGQNFDPYPFILLNLFLSLIAALQAPVIMMSQNRQEAKDRKRSEHDYLINLKAELEIRSLHQKLDLMLMEQLKALLKSQQQQLELLSKLVENRD